MKNSLHPLEVDRRVVGARKCAALWVAASVIFCGGVHSAFGQDFSIPWYKIAGGGGDSSGGTYQVSGTIGQPDASGVSTGGSYSLTGGFWSLISVVQTAGLPDLMVTRVGGAVVVSWPNTGSYTLQQNANLTTPAGWASNGYPITSANGTNSITIAAPSGNFFFRLKQ
jgi:hypothetical protein